MRLRETGRLRLAALLLVFLPILSPGVGGRPAIAKKKEEVVRRTSPAEHLTALVSWGEKGALRVVFEGPRSRGLSESSGMFEATILNEGEEPFALAPEDKWFLMTTDKRRIEAVWLRLERTRSLALAPHSAWEVLLSAEKTEGSTVVSVEYECHGLSRTIAVTNPYQWPQETRSLSPRLPDALASSPEGQIRLSARISPEGRVEQVFVLSGVNKEKDLTLRDAAIEALESSVFKPAMEAGSPVAVIVDRTFDFTNETAIAASFAMPAAELRTGLEKFVRTYTTVMGWPRMSGLLGVEPARPEPGGASVGAVVMRYGAGESPGTSWVVVRALREQSLLTSAGCECPRPAGVEGESKRAFDRLVSALGMAPDGAATFPALGKLLPGLSPEPPTDGDWSEGAVRRILRRALRERGSAEAVGSRAMGANRGSDTLSENDLLNLADPVLAVGEVKQPKLITKVQPTYPENARRSHVEGKVILEAIIDTDGAVTDVRVLRSIPIFDSAAIDAVCGWRYEPPTRGGKPIEVFFTVVVDFTLTR